MAAGVLTTTWSSLLTVTVLAPRSTLTTMSLFRACTSAASTQPVGLASHLGAGGLAAGPDGEGGDERQSGGPGVVGADLHRNSFSWGGGEHRWEAGRAGLSRRSRASSRSGADPRRRRAPGSWWPW